MATPISLKIGTFNTENLFIRYLFNRMKKEKSITPSHEKIDELSHDALGFSLEDFQTVNGPQRRNTARVITENQPDILAVQEVENIMALKLFDRNYLNKSYEYKMLIDGNDSRGIDVGIFSKYPIVHVRSFQFDKDQEGTFIFSRDCLEADILLPNKKLLTVYVNHFKSKIGGGEERRRKQANQVTKIIQDRFGEDLDKHDFVIFGDLNAGPKEQELKSLLELNGIENVVQTRLPEADRWTHYYLPENKAEQLDYLLLSSSLTKKNLQAVPFIERRGLGDYVKIYQGPRFPGVGSEGTEASDHCAIYMPIQV